MDDECKEWECPTCETTFDKDAVKVFIKKLETWLDGRPSASMEPCDNKRNQVIRILHELKSHYVQHIRKPSRVMEAQNAIGEQDAIGKRTES